MAVQHHLFLSYAHADNQPARPGAIGWVEGFKQRLEQRHRAFSGQPLRIFYDSHCLRAGDDWENRIGQALRSSQLLLAFLSPAYLQSAWCRREWEEYLRLEHTLSRSEGGIVPVYFASAPELDPKQQVELEEQFRAWIADIQRVQHQELIDVRPWYDGGAEALELLASEERLQQLAAAPRADATLRAQDFADQLAQLDRAIAHRLDLALLAEQAQMGGFLTASYERFVGRGQQLRDLHRLLSAGRVSLIAALHGLGGQGKSALAVQYAYAYGGYYACGGRWLVGCEGKRNLLEVFETLALMLGCPLSDAEQALSDQAKFALYRQRFQAHCEAGRERIVGLLRQQGGDWFTPVEQRDCNIAPRMLVILDNVDQPELLGGQQLGAFPKDEWLDFLVTSRLGPDELGLEEAAAIEIGDLPPADALALLRSHHAFAGDAEEAAARELVAMVQGHVLSIDLIGAHVRVQARAGYSYAKMRDALKAQGVGAFEDPALGKARGELRAAVTAQTISAIMEQTLARLSAAEVTILEYASLCPPDLVPVNWLRDLVESDHPELAAPEGPSLAADPWPQALERLDDWRLLRANPQEGENEEPSASIHRLVAETLRVRMGAERREALRELLIGLADDFATVLEHQARLQRGMTERWLTPLTELTMALLERDRPDQRLISNIGVCAHFATRLSGITAAQRLVEMRHEMAVAHAEANPQDGQALRDLSVAQNMLGDFHQRRGGAGDADLALGYYQASLATRERLARDNPQDEQAQRDLSVSQERLGDFHQRRGGAGDADLALGYHQASLATAERLARDNPQDARAQRDLSVSQTKLGDFFLRRGGPGDFDLALGYYQAALDATEPFARDNPQDGQAQRDLSVSQNRLGDFYRRRGGPGDADLALGYYRASLGTREQLARTIPQDREAQRDLSVSQAILGDFFLRRGEPGDFDLALGYYTESLVTRERLALDNPQDGEAQRDLSGSQTNLGDFFLLRGDPGDTDLALAFYLASLATDERLASDNPQDGEAQRDLAISHERLGDFYEQRGGSGDLEAALDYFETAAVTRHELVAANPAIGELRAELIVPLTRLLFVLLKLGQEENAFAVARTLATHLDEWDAMGFEPDRRIEGARKTLLQLLGRGDTP
ncbi:toll/interleukin-1 receptor domain-containing protein [Erythrobacter oryzae]|uniref:toll/interleukin-1 receptor domain-containing protein n=1 Tax=Erythrobacter oryzae TaxID=3019556 RepID=UPI0025555DBB|nr:toll/interleukin-1 receptor domain-containing protein [Erythrobacter sp. COR-2]